MRTSGGISPFCLVVGRCGEYTEVKLIETHKAKCQADATPKQETEKNVLSACIHFLLKQDEKK